MSEKIKRTSKYVGRTFNKWKVVDIFVKSVQGKKCSRKRVMNAKGNMVLANSANPRSTQYTYMLERTTRDGKCEKRIAVNGAQMRSIALGKLNAETLADTFFGKAKTDYRFN